MERFARGAIDFLIGPTFAMEEGFEREDLYHDRFKCVLSRDNPLARHMTPEDFFAAPQVVTEFFLDDGKSHFERWLSGQQRPVKVVAALPSFVVLPHYIAGTENVATIHNRLVPQFASNPDLVFIDPPVDIPPLTEHLVANRRNKHDADAERLKAVMLEVGRSM
jgi:LysR family nod box-dependent transcriptional activator